MNESSGLKLSAAKKTMADDYATTLWHLVTFSEKWPSLWRAPHITPGKYFMIL